MESFVTDAMLEGLARRGELMYVCALCVFLAFYFSGSFYLVDFGKRQSERLGKGSEWRREPESSGSAILRT